MNTLVSLQRYANNHWAVDKTRRTHCTFKQGAIYVTEHRLWIWMLDEVSPVLVKAQWLTGSDKNDFKAAFDGIFCEFSSNGRRLKIIKEK